MTFPEVVGKALKDAGKKAEHDKWWEECWEMSFTQMKRRAVFYYFEIMFMSKTKNFFKHFFVIIHTWFINIG